MLVVCSLPLFLLAQSHSKFQANVPERIIKSPQSVVVGIFLLLFQVLSSVFVQVSGMLRNAQSSQRIDFIAHGYLLLGVQDLFPDSLTFSAAVLFYTIDTQIQMLPVQIRLDKQAVCLALKRVSEIDRLKQHSVMNFCQGLYYGLATFQIRDVQKPLSHFGPQFLHLLNGSTTDYEH